MTSDQVDSLAKALGASVVSEDLKELLNRELKKTEIKLLSWLHRRTLPQEILPILVECTEIYIRRKYKTISGSWNNLQGDDLVMVTDDPQVASVSDNGQSVSFTSRFLTSNSAAASASGLDDVMGQYFDILQHYRLVRLAFYLKSEKEAANANPV